MLFCCCFVLSPMRLEIVVFINYCFFMLLQNVHFLAGFSWSFQRWMINYARLSISCDTRGKTLPKTNLRSEEIFTADKTKQNKTKASHKQFCVAMRCVVSALWQKLFINGNASIDGISCCKQEENFFASQRAERSFNPVQKSVIEFKLFVSNDTINRMSWSIVMN